MESYGSHNVKKKDYDSTGYRLKFAIFQKIRVELEGPSHYIHFNEEKDEGT
jgi:hypothetical protein